MKTTNGMQRSYFSASVLPLFTLLFALVLSTGRHALIRLSIWLHMGE